MENIEKFANERMPSTINDPFFNDCIESIYVSYDKGMFTGKWKATGRVKFTNRNTNGSQDFNGETFDDVVLKIKSFLNELKNK